MSRRLAAIGVLLLSPMALQAQNLCSAQDTLASCQQKVASSMGELTDELTDVAEQKDSIVAAKNTGEGTIDTLGSASSINDFLPLLRAIVDTGALGDDGGQGLGFEWSNPLGLPPQHQNKVSIAAADATVYEPLKDALRAAGMGDSIDALQDDIDSGDDIVIAFSYSPASSTKGRDPSLQHDLFSAMLNAAASTSDESTAAREAADRRRIALNRELELRDVFEGTMASRVPAARQQEYVKAIEDSYVAEYGDMAALRGRLEKNGFYGLLDLVNNQPQLTFAANYRARSDAVGPDEFRAVVAYEMGWYNMNTMRASCRNQPELACAAKYLADENVRQGLKSSPRVTFSAEYVERQKLSFALPDSAFAYSEKSGKALRVNAIWGRYMGGENADRARSRLDLALSYEDISDDPSRQDRGLASATLSYPVARGFYLSFGAVYATKPEFRGDVDEELSARAGLVYKVIREAP